MRIRIPATLFASLAAAWTLGACGGNGKSETDADAEGDGDGTGAVTCASALEHYYGASCALPDEEGTGDMSLESALSRCGDWEALALDRECSTPWRAFLECIATVGTGDCAACDADKEDLDRCWGDDRPPLCPGYAGPDAECCVLVDDCGLAGNGACDCDGACPWDAADCEPDNPYPCRESPPRSCLLIAEDPALQERGCCFGNTAYWCESDMMTISDCNTDGGTCDLNVEAGRVDCLMLECAAPPPTSCAMINPEPGWFQERGCCYENTAYWCQSDALQSEDCGETGGTCTWSETAGRAACLP